MFQSPITQHFLPKQCITLQTTMLLWNKHSEAHCLDRRQAPAQSAPVLPPALISWTPQSPTPLNLPASCPPTSAPSPAQQPLLHATAHVPSPLPSALPLPPLPSALSGPLVAPLGAVKGSRSYSAAQLQQLGSFDQPQLHTADTYSLMKGCIGQVSTWPQAPVLSANMHMPSSTAERPAEAALQPQLDLKGMQAC